MFYNQHVNLVREFVIVIQNKSFSFVPYELFQCEIFIIIIIPFYYLFLTGDYTITVSHLEIYQEELNDLLSPHNEVRFMYISFQDSSSLVVVVLLLFLEYILSDNLKQMFFTNRLFSLSLSFSRVLSRALSRALSLSLSLSFSLQPQGRVFDSTSFET